MLACTLTITENKINEVLGCKVVGGCKEHCQSVESPPHADFLLQEPGVPQPASSRRYAWYSLIRTDTPAPGNNVSEQERKNIKGTVARCYVCI